MALLTIGLNHKTAPVEIRERVVFSPDRIDDALREIVHLDEVREAAILSTCNRTELYCHLEHNDQRAVVDWLSQYHHLPVSDLNSYLYSHPNEDSIRHMLRVATGLDSMILGEPQILGQMKDAYDHALQAGTVGMLLGRLFQHTFSVAKQVRTDTAIGASPVSVAFAAVSLAKQIFGDLHEHTALLIGAGETIELAARHLHNNGIGRMIVANRTIERAHDLAGPFQAYAISLEELPAHLAEADIVISSTASPEPVVQLADIKRALKQRKHRPMFMVDIAVPRDIDPQVGKLEDVYLYTVDDLQDVIQENLNSRQAAAKEAEQIIEIQVEHFMSWVKSLDAVNTICQFRTQAESIRDEVLHKALKQVQQGKTPEEVLSYLANTLTNKLLHNPTTNLRQASMHGRQELLRAIRELYELPDPDSRD